MSSERMVVLFSVDGMRPDGVLEAETPVMRRLIQEGASTLKAQTVMPSVTLPCHTSMLRGVDVPRHGITSNTFQPLARPVPSLLDVARGAGKRTGFLFNWPELRDLCAPGSLDVAYALGNCHSHDSDYRIAAETVRHLKESAFDLLFVYLGWTDECGHKHGWMSPEYLEAIGHADRCIGQVLEACEATGRPVTALVQSDHGGHGRSHGTEIPEDMTIPWILSGDGVKTDHTLQTEVRIFDTCCTLAHLLGLPQAREWDGKVITEALL